MNYLTPEELVAVLRVARSRSARDWPMILIAYRHGMRASEVCGLKLADVDLKTDSISIRRLKRSLQSLFASKTKSPDARFSCGSHTAEAAGRSVR